MIWEIIHNSRTAFYVVGKISQVIILIWLSYEQRDSGLLF